MSKDYADFLSVFICVYPCPVSWAVFDKHTDRNADNGRQDEAGFVGEAMGKNGRYPPLVI
ncbi:MAG: hypothetical protein IAF02_10370 [Anaerolineae bacterium]|nr:hypothetical protein [Anaerolineae bacterium]